MRLVEPLEHLLVHDVEDQHVGVEQGLDVGVIKQRLGQEVDRDPVTEIRSLVEQRLVGAKRAGKVAVRKQVGDAHLLRRHGCGKQQHNRSREAKPRTPRLAGAWGEAPSNQAHK